MGKSSSNLLQLFLSEKQQHHLMERVEHLHHHHHHQEDLLPEQEEDQLHGALKPIKIVPAVAKEKDEEEEEGFKTPTSEEHRIPAMVECPPAPAKNKNNKRTKHSCYYFGRFQSSVIHYSHQEIDSLFPALHHHHLHGGNTNTNNNKKIKLS